MNTLPEIFTSMRRPLCALWDKWQSEEKGAPFKRYTEEAKDHLKGVAPDATFVSAKPKPFALTFKLGDHHYRLTVTDARYTIKRLP